MKLTKNVFLSLSLVLFILFSGNISNAQETPDENEDNNTPVVDSIDLSEDLLDSNEVYKKQFESLSDEGEWEELNKSDFLSDLSAETGEDFEIDYSQATEVIYVWRPNCVGQSWNPYTHGNWIFTYYGWVWVSSYNWGWGPYNYGRWYFSNYYGWVWLPGRIWAANWVTWRCHNNYVGWYPTCPRVYWRNHRNIICTNNLFSYEPVNWVFVKRNDFTKTVNNATIVSSGSNSGILKKSQKPETAIFATSGASKIKYKGPDVSDISKATGKIISPKEVEVTNKKGKLRTDEKNVLTYKKGSSKVKEPGLKTKQDKPVKKNTIKKENYSGTKPVYKNPPTDTGTKKVKDKKSKELKNNDSNSKDVNKVTETESKPEKVPDGSSENNSEKKRNGSNENNSEKKSDESKESNTKKSSDESKENNAIKSNDESDGSNNVDNNNSKVSKDRNNPVKKK